MVTMVHLKNEQPIAQIKMQLHMGVQNMCKSETKKGAWVVMRGKGKKRVLALVMAAALMSSQFMGTGTIQVQAEEGAEDVVETTSEETSSEVQKAEVVESKVESTDETESSGIEKSSVEESIIHYTKNILIYQHYQKPNTFKL